MTVVTASADLPLMQSNATPLEVDHRTFVASLAHESRIVLGLRLLETGTAKDVSGVLRLSRGPQLDSGEDEEEVQPELLDRDVLFFINGDGSVKVFERGA